MKAAERQFKMQDNVTGSGYLIIIVMRDNIAREDGERDIAGIEELGHACERGQRQVRRCITVQIPKARSWDRCIVYIRINIGIGSIRTTAEILRAVGL